MIYYIINDSLLFSRLTLEARINLTQVTQENLFLT